MGSNCILVLVGVVICLIYHFQSGKFDPDYHPHSYGHEYDRGSFDLGSWSCQLSTSHALLDGDQILSRQCIDETAALWIDLLLALSNFGMAILVWMDWRGQSVLIREYNSLMNEHAMDYI